MSSTRDTLLKLTTGRKVEPVETPEGKFHARGLTAADWDEYENGSAHEEAGKVVYRANRALLFRLAVCEPDGSAVFTAADDAALKNLPRSVVEPVCLAAQRLSGATRAADADAGKSSPAPSASG